MPDVSVATFKQGLVRALQSRGLYRPWIRQVLDAGLNIKLVNEVSDPSASALYKSGSVEFKRDAVWVNGAVPDDKLAEVVHELWHAYYDLCVEEQVDVAAAVTGRVFRRTQDRLDTPLRPPPLPIPSPIGWIQGSAPTAADNFTRSGVGNAFNTHVMGDSKAEAMADELWSHYIEEVMNAVMTIGGTARTAEEAQRWWDYLAPKTEVFLDTTYLDRGTHTDLRGDVATYIQHQLLGINENVQRWPSGLRGWEQLTRAYPAFVARALVNSGAASRGATPQRVLLRFVDEILRNSSSPFRPAWVAAGSPAIQTQSGVRTTIERRGQGSVIRVAEAIAEEKPLGNTSPLSDIKYVRIDLGTLGHQLTNALVEAGAARQQLANARLRQ